MTIEQFTDRLNAWGAARVPFLFVIDFELKKPQIFSIEEIDSAKILYNINGIGNHPTEVPGKSAVDLMRFPISFEEYRKKYDVVRARLAYGDSYLTNLTVRTKVKTPLTLREIFFRCHARYKLWFDHSFLVFSPETFVRISEGKIFAHPMKGTIDAAVPGAKEKILSDLKEMAEHVTIVDLIRNDLSSVATNVQVTRFRYVEEIRTIHKDLLQVSSEIQGNLPSNYHDHLGDILLSLLPAGSVSGAPKCKTLDIIRDAEAEPRGYYTGVVGLFDGKSLDSGVMIRFMEERHGELFYRSGGGITTQSEPDKEYQETIDKVYVPLN